MPRYTLAKSYIATSLERYYEQLTLVARRSWCESYRDPGVNPTKTELVLFNKKIETSAVESLKLG